MKEYKLFAIVCMATLLAIWSLHSECGLSDNQNETEAILEHGLEQSTYNIKVGTSDVNFDELEKSSDEFALLIMSSLTDESKVNLYLPDIRAYVDNTSDMETEHLDNIISKETMAYMEDSVLVSYVTNTSKIINILSWIDANTGEIHCDIVKDADNIETYQMTLDSTVECAEYIQKEFVNTLLGEDSDIFYSCKDSISVIATDIGDRDSITTKYKSYGFGRKDIKLVDRVFLLLNYVDVDGNQVQYGIIIKYNLNGNVYDIDIIS